MYVVIIATRTPLGPHHPHHSQQCFLLHSYFFVIELIALHFDELVDLKPNFHLQGHEQQAYLPKLTI